MMHCNISNRSRGASAGEVTTLFAIVLAMGLGLMARPAAAPIAYVANSDSNNVSVIDTATNTVVATVPVGNFPFGVAVTPNGKHVYVTNFSSNNVSVIDTASNMAVGSPIPVGNRPVAVAVTPDGKHAYVANFGRLGTVSVIATATNKMVATVTVGSLPIAVAVTPDGKYVYVVNLSSGNVSVIATATNTVVATVGVGTNPFGVAVTPDGTYAYVTVTVSSTVSVIDTATNMVVATVPVGSGPGGVTVNPDGKHAYVENFGSSNVSVIDTGTNKVVATVPVGNSPNAAAVAPDGKHAYVANAGSNNVSLIDTATNTVVGTPIPVGSNPFAVGIVPPSACVPFSAFSAKLEIDLESKPNKDRFELLSSFTLGSASNGINPLTETVTLQIGTLTTTIPPGSLKKIGQGIFVFHGVIGGVTLQALIVPTGAKRYAIVAAALDANLIGTKNPVPVTLTVGDDCGTISVEALISH